MLGQLYAVETWLLTMAPEQHGPVEPPAIAKGVSIAVQCSSHQLHVVTGYLKDG